jgi:hypothetical protein
MKNFRLQHLASWLCLLVTLVYLPDARAQSLDPKAPAQLKAGVNTGMADSTVGPHFWYFIAEPAGQFDISVTFKSLGVLGSAMPMTLAVTISNDPPTGSVRKTVTSEKSPAIVTFNGKFDKRTKVLLRVDPLSAGPLRQGGDYQIQVTGGVSFANATSTSDPIVHTYVRVYDSSITKFLANGTVSADNGKTGTWKLQDADSHSYSAVLGDEKWGFQYKPGRGLVSAGDESDLVFKQLH